MSLVNTLKTGLKDFLYANYVFFFKMNIKDIPYQFNVMFPKVPKNPSEGMKLYFKDYVPSEDIEKMKGELRGYNFLK